MASIFEGLDMKDIMAGYILTKGTKTVEIYGEDHAKQLPEENSYIQMAEYILGTKAKVFVEHTTVACNLNNLDDETIQYMLSYGGSDTIFYILQNEEYKNLYCIDNRLELRLISKVLLCYSKRYITETLGEETGINKDLVTIIKILDDSIKNLLCLESYFALSSYDEIYGVFMHTLERQLQIVHLFAINYTHLCRGDPGRAARAADILDREIIEGGENWEIFKDMILIILDNLEKIGSLVVDINILTMIKKSRASKIILYAGMNHANRVASILEGNGYHSTVLKGENTADTIGISGFEVEIEDKLLEALQ